MRPSPKSSVSTFELILVPAILSLAITLVRLTGELLEWSPTLFNRAPGGGGSPLGISWLVPVFGLYFAIRLTRAGQGPQSAVKTIAIAIAGAVAGTAVIVPFVSEGASAMALASWAVGALIGVGLQAFGWPELFRTLLAYAFAARIPVAIIMLMAIVGGWQTHYDVAPPDFPARGPLLTWFYIGAVPQFTFWIFFTVVIGCLFGGLTALVVKPRVR